MILLGGDMAGELPLNDRGENIVRIGHSPDPDDAFMFHAMTTMHLKHQVMILFMN